MKKVKATSIAEVVIALAIIAICFTVASLVFIRSISGMRKFVDFKNQTSIQNKLMEQMLEGESTFEFNDLDVEELKSENDSLVEYHFSNSDNKLIWKQEWLRK